MPAIRTDAILCDGIHQEVNGKFILVGVMAGVLETNGPFFKSDFCLYVNFHGLPEGKHNIDLKLTSPEKKSTQTQISAFIPEGVMGATLQITGIPFNTEQSGSFVLSWKLSDSKKWTTLLEVPVELSVDMTEISALDES
ncbi:DUF6941 family protein [Szabonella alba]|uniref:Uncharacterized protein n=1 Tax=Szabonella alba TaxID=2804194 RepID=A0A8K0V836_9RHOB|nr:hypothetical protein [Szabonella alba]MBL4917454.1 hypothetical protein [Szabonella alba]